MSDILNDIVCIGTNNNAEVNVYYGGTNRDVPVIEILCNGRVAMTLPQAEGIIELVREAMEHWREEGA